ncbi:MAG TPA: tetratricopeptide repeat protein, partial [Streptosporangiaceae bacterium]|nr:tetratricopeptide repeat protein [Streptosporangiaceae bacterium]
EALRLPPAGANRLGVALAVAAVVSAAAGGPLFWWAGRDRLNEQPSGDGTASGGRLPADQVVVGEIPRQPPAFVERQTLARLAGAAGSGRVAVVCAVTGLRGVGKTHLAAAYARERIAQGWGLVGWVSAESRGSLLADLARVAERLGVADPEGDSAESARRLRDHLGTRAREGLLVFDNAADPGLLRPFLPATGGTQIVVTSTSRVFAELGAMVDVAAFSRAESLDYLEERTSLDDPDGAAAVAAELGDLPLALAQAAATIAGQHLTYPVYLERLRQAPVAELLAGVPGGDYPHATGPVLLLNVTAAEDGDPSGLTSRVLRAMSVLSAEGAGRGLLNALDDQTSVDAAIQRCVAWSLLAWSVTGHMVMHRLLGRVLRERDHAAGESDAALGLALSLLEPRLFSEDQAWARRDEGSDLAAQIEAVWHAGVETGGPALVGRALAARSWAVRQFRVAADLTRAIDLGERTLAAAEQVLGPDHPDTMAARNNLASAYQSAGRLGEAILLFEQALADRKRILGPDHPDSLGSRNNLASAYQSAGRLGEAILLFEQALADRERVLGPDHPDTLTSRDNLASAYQSARRTDEAIPLYEATLADRERVLGPDHPDTLTSRNNLADAYWSANRQGEAILRMKTALADRERVLGPDHPDTLTSRNNLAGYQSAGQVVGAIPIFERILADREQVLGPDHPDTMAARNNLGSTYKSAGQLSKAITLFERTLADRERILGPDHPDTFWSRNNLAFAYMAAGWVDKALTLFAAVLADSERVLGPDHPDTLAAQNNLAGAYHEVGDQVGKSIDIFERHVADLERVLGPDHPVTLAAQDRLGQEKDFYWRY